MDATPQTPHLVIDESGSTRICLLDGTEVTIGRSRQNTVRLADKNASRIHCRILRTGIGYRVVDAASSNRTRLNGREIDEAELADGDAIQVGLARITFHAGPSAPPPPPPPIALQDRAVQILLETLVNASTAKDLDGFLMLALDNVIEIAPGARAVFFFFP